MHATRLLGSYTSLWHTHQPIGDLLTQLSRHVSTAARANEGYEINFYSAAEPLNVCNTVVQTLRQRQGSCDLNASFVVCLKRDGVATYCLSDFLGAAAFSRNTTGMGEMYANPLAIQESSTESGYEAPITDPYYSMPMKARATIRIPEDHDWNSTQYAAAGGRMPTPDTWDPAVYIIGSKVLTV